MSHSLLRTDKEIAEIYARQGKTVYRVCFAYMKNTADTEDAVQDTFFRLIGGGPAFESEEHEKAWLIRTAVNVCKNMLRRRKRENRAELGDIPAADGIKTDDVLRAVLQLPDKYKAAVYLYYYDGYTGDEIARMLKKPPSTVRNHLRDARALLKERLGANFNEEQ